MYRPDTSHIEGRRALAAILSGAGMTSLGMGIFAFTIPLVSLDERVSGAWLGGAFAAYYLARLLVSPLAGLASDRFGPRLILLIAMIAGSLTPLLYFISPTMTVLYAIQVVMGMVTGLIRPVSMASLGATETGLPLSRRFSLHGALTMGGTFIGPILGGLLYLGRSMEPVLIALAACMGAATLATAMLLPKDVSTLRSRQSGQSQEEAPPREQTLTLLLAITGRTLGTGLLVAFYPILLVTTLGRRGLVIAVLYAIPGLTTFLGLALSGRFSHPKQGIGHVATGMLISAAGLLCLSQSTELWQFASAGAVTGLGAALSMPASMTLASTLSERQGALFGTANLASGVGFLAGPILGGIMVQSFRSVQPAMIFAALAGALSCIPLIVILLKRRFHMTAITAWGVTTLCGIFLVTMTGLSLDNRMQSPGKDLYRFTDVAMGTIVNLTLEAYSRQAAAEAASRAMAAMRALQQDFDHRNPDGSVGRVNRNAGGAWVKPTPRAFALLERSLDLSAASHGVFDPTVGALTTSPLYFALDTTVAHAKSDLVDYRLVELDRTAGRVRLQKKGMALDLGGIAKGAIVDSIVALLRKQEIPSGIVEAGGDFYCFGDRDWTVGIRHPRQQDVHQKITVREKGVCGSGDYQQFITTESGGKSETRHHLIDPATMESAGTSIGVTVIADSTEKADALATTLFIMGPSRGAGFLDHYSPQSAAIWFLPDLSVARTDNFPE